MKRGLPMQITLTNPTPEMLIAQLVISLALAIVIYIFTGLSLYTIANRRNIENAWLAWVPIGSSWIAGMLADQYMMIARGQTTKYRYFATWFTAGNLALTIVLLLIPFPYMVMNSTIASFFFLASGLSITSAVFLFISLHKIYLSCKGVPCGGIMALSIIFPYVLPFFLFSMRHRDDGLYPGSFCYNPTGAQNGSYGQNQGHGQNQNYEQNPYNNEIPVASNPPYEQKTNTDNSATPTDEPFKE